VIMDRVAVGVRCYNSGLRMGKDGVWDDEVFGIGSEVNKFR